MRNGLGVAGGRGVDRSCGGFVRQSLLGEPTRGDLARAGLNGRIVETVISFGDSWDIAIDSEAGAMYWTANQHDLIFRANLDGTSNEIIIQVDNPNGIALDTGAGKVYWTSFNNGLIRRADLDGGNIELLVQSPGTGMSGIALDVAAKKMYWAEFFENRIRRANFDGTAVELLVESFRAQWITLDAAGGKMYWTASHSASIQRANLDGSDVEIIYDRGWWKEGIAIDLPGRKIYWAEYARIQRADLDGRNVEDVVTCGVGFARGITLVRTQACSFADGSCSDLPEAFCRAQGGIPQGIDTTCELLCPGDVDGNGDVGVTDLLAILGAWGPCCACREDLDESGEVGAAELQILLRTWGSCE